MTGSLQTKNEKFYIVLNDTVNGKRKQRWIATGLSVKGNKRKAKQMLREKLAEGPAVCTGYAVGRLCKALADLRAAARG